MKTLSNYSKKIKIVMAVWAQPIACPKERRMKQKKVKYPVGTYVGEKQIFAEIKRNKMNRKIVMK